MSKRPTASLFGPAALFAEGEAACGRLGTGGFKPEKLKLPEIKQEHVLA